MPAGISALAPGPPSGQEIVDAVMMGSTVAAGGTGMGKSFTILQRDLESSLPLLHVNGIDDDDARSKVYDTEDEDEDDEDDDSVASKMTTIKRNDSSVFARQKQLSKSNDQVHLVNLPKPIHGSRSHGNLNERIKPFHNYGCRGQNSMHLSTEDFNEALSAKLRKIQEQEAEESRRQAAKASQVHHPRPFITTVKTGEFLMPPPEVAVLLGIAPSPIHGTNSDLDDLDGQQCRARFRHQLTSLHKKPEVRHNMHQARCPLVALRPTEEFILYGGSNCTSGFTSARKPTVNNLKRDHT